MGLPLVVGFKNLPPHPAAPFKSQVTLVGGETKWETRRRDNVENDQNINFKTLP